MNDYYPLSCSCALVHPIVSCLLNGVICPCIVVALVLLIIMHGCTVCWVNCTHLYPVPRHPAYMSSYLDLQLLHHPSKDKYSSITAYGTSKLCNLLFALQFHRNNVEQGVYCNAVHPGNLLPTNLTRDLGLMYKAAFTMARPFTKSVVSCKCLCVCVQIELSP